MKNLETEYKWQVDSVRDFSRALAVFKTLARVSYPNNLNICDTYLDHANGDFAKEKIAFRVRRVCTKWEATFKTRSEIKNGKAVRREETLPLPGVKNLAQALAFLQCKKTWENLDVCDLQKRFVLKNKRRIFTVIYKKCKAELALDNFVISVFGHDVKMKEIELERKSGTMDDFEELSAKFSAQSGFAFSSISKVKTAEMLRDKWSKHDESVGPFV